MLSSTCSSPRSASRDSTSSRVRPSMGLIILPRRSGMPHRPRRPAPRARFSSIVSALSSAVWAVAMAAAPRSSAVRSRKS